MSLELRMRERFAKRAARFVEKRKAQLGCAKAAMADVARKLGMSVTGLYRAMNGYGAGKIQAHHHAALILHSVGIVKAAASRMGRKTRASSIHV